MLRDVDFDVADRVPFQEIKWNEPQRNDYRLEGESRVANVEKQETFEIRLAKAEFPRRVLITGGWTSNRWDDRGSACCSCA